MMGHTPWAEDQMLVALSINLEVKGWSGSLKARQIKKKMICFFCIENNLNLLVG